MYIPEIAKNDPWLKPYQDKIIERSHRAKIQEKELLTGAKSLYEFADGYLYFGLHKKNKKWVFREWAPAAKEIYLIGEFSDWQAQPEYTLERAGDIWEITLPAKVLKHADLYKLLIRWEGGEGTRIPAWCQRVVQDEESKIFNAQVYDPPKKHKWKKPNYINQHKNPIIYEAHVGMATEEGKTGTYEEFRKNVLPKIIKGGYNTLQLMAVQEHPYYGSFGYHVSNFFAASSRFGTPEELKALIDEAHKNNISVIMDIVHSHAVKNELEGLSRFDGTYYQYFHDGPKGNHDLWDSRCFDYGKREVLKFLLSNCRYWLEEYKFDGFRFDGVTSMLYLDHGSGKAFTSYDFYFDQYEDEEAITYLALANKLIHEYRPDAFTIAEEVSGMPGLAAPLSKGGYGFDYRLAMGVPDYWIKLIKEQKDEDWNIEQIYYELTSRRADEQTISYAESHDQALVGDKTIIFRLIDKDMYTDMHKDYKNLTVERGIALHKIIRLITITTGGHGYLNFMGNEFGHPEWIDFPREGNNWSYHYARRQWSLATNKDLRYQYLDKFDIDMIKTVRKESVFDQAYPYVLVKHNGDKVLIYKRSGLYFVFNFNPTQSFTDYAFEIEAGKYKIILNSDSEKYGGYNRIDDSMTYETMPLIDEFYSPHQIKLYIPNRSAFILKKIDTVNY